MASGFTLPSVSDAVRGCVSMTKCATRVEIVNWVRTTREIARDEVERNINTVLNQMVKRKELIKVGRATYAFDGV